MSILRKGCVTLSNLRVKGPPVSVPVTAAVLILSLNPACCLRCALVVGRVSVALLVGGGGCWLYGLGGFHHVGLYCGFLLNSLTIMYYDSDN